MYGARERKDSRIKSTVFPYFFLFSYFSRFPLTSHSLHYLAAFLSSSFSIYNLSSFSFFSPSIFWFSLHSVFSSFPFLSFSCIHFFVSFTHSHSSSPLTFVQSHQEGERAAIKDLAASIHALGMDKEIAALLITLLSLVRQMEEKPGAVQSASRTKCFSLLHLGQQSRGEESDW